jgi:hypothetical protein
MREIKCREKAKGYRNQNIDGSTGGKISYNKVAVQWYYQALCFVSISVVG